MAQTSQANGETIATRQASQQALEALGPALPELLGGSADLTGSNNTNRKDSKVDQPATTRRGNYLHYGVREFGMARDHERHRAARRLDPVRRHVPGVLRLRAQRACAWRR